MCKCTCIYKHAELRFVYSFGSACLLIRIFYDFSKPNNKMVYCINCRFSACTDLSLFDRCFTLGLRQADFELSGRKRGSWIHNNFRHSSLIRNMRSHFRYDSVFRISVLFDCNAVHIQQKDYAEDVKPFCNNGNCNGLRNFDVFNIVLHSVSDVFSVTKKLRYLRYRSFFYNLLKIKQLF